MSTIYVDNVAGQGGGTSTDMMLGLAKALLDYDQTVPTTNDSYNVSSVNDNAAGDFTVTITNAMSAASPYVSLHGQERHQEFDSGTATTSTVTRHQSSNSAETAVDDSDLGWLRFGDLA